MGWSTASAQGEEAAGVRRVWPARPLPSLMPFSAATRRLCSRRMFSWDALRLGCLRMHCMVQPGAQGQGWRRMGGPRRPGEGPCSSSSLRCPTGLRGASGGAGRSQAGEGRVQRGVGPWEVSPAPLTSTRWMLNRTQAPAGSRPGRKQQFCYSHMPEGFYASLPAAGGHPKAVGASQSVPRAGQRSLPAAQLGSSLPFPSLPSAQGCSALAHGEEEAKSTFEPGQTEPKRCSETLF